MIACALAYLSFQKALPEVKILPFWCNTLFIFCPIQEITLLSTLSYVNGSQGCNLPSHFGCKEGVDFFIVVTVFILHRTDHFRKLISSHPYLSFSQAPEHSWHFLSGIFLCPACSGVSYYCWRWQVVCICWQAFDRLLTSSWSSLTYYNTSACFSRHSWRLWQPLRIARVELGKRGYISFISIAAGASSSRVVTAVLTMKVQPAVFIRVLLCRVPSLLQSKDHQNSIRRTLQDHVLLRIILLKVTIPVNQ